MARGDPQFYDDKPGSLARLRALLLKFPIIGVRLRRARRILSDFDIPYLGGIARDGRYVYLDRRLPEKVDGNIPIAKYLEVHEATEYAIYSIAQKVKGLAEYRTYEPDHHLATAAEQYALVSDGYDWDKYEDALRPDFYPIEHEKIKRVPPDLALFQYDSDKPLQDHLKKCMSQTKFTQAEVQYRAAAPSSRARCGTCAMFLAKLAKCEWVQGAIAPDDVCDKWEKKT